MTSTPKFRYIGVTDECTTCEKCGKPELKSTMIISLLDEDGNDTGDAVYYGSTCGARALNVKGGGRAALQSARWAMERLRAEVAEARERLTRYGIPEEGDLTPRQWMPIRVAFVEHNTRNWPEWRKELRYGHPDFVGSEQWQKSLEGCVARWRQAVRDAKLTGL